VVFAASAPGFEEFGIGGEAATRERRDGVHSRHFLVPARLKPELLKTGAPGVVRGGFRRIRARI